MRSSTAGPGAWALLGPPGCFRCHHGAGGGGLPSDVSGPSVSVFEGPALALTSGTSNFRTWRSFHPEIFTRGLCEGAWGHGCCRDGETLIMGRGGESKLQTELSSVFYEVEPYEIAIFVGQK